MNDLKEQIAERNPDAIIFDGLDAALVGFSWRFDMTNPVALYDYDKCIEILIKEGATHEDATSHMDHNVTGAWLGENTPAFCSMQHHH